MYEKISIKNSIGMENKRKHFSFGNYGIFIVFAVLFVSFSIATPSFLTLGNLVNVTRQVSMIGIASVGMMFVMIAGGIDLSVGSLLSFVNVFCAYLMVNMNVNPFIAVSLALLIAAVGGWTNGLVITQLKVPPLISTMAFMEIWSGIAFLISKGMPLYGLPEEYLVLGQGYVGPIPVPVIVMICFIVLGAFLLSKTYFGRYFFAVGGNEEAAQLSGINVKQIKRLVYILCSVFTAAAGAIMLSRLNSGQATTGSGFEFQVITAVVLGGVSISGGIGKISHVVVGVLIMGVLLNGLVLLNINEYIQRIVQGVVLIAAVGFDCLSRKE